MDVTLSALLAACAGACLAFQAGTNNRLREVLDAPGIWASYCSILGTITFSTLCMLILRPSPPSWATVKSVDWWMWIGGPLGVLVVLAGTFLVQHLGAALFIAFVVAGQLLSSLLIDHFGLMGLPQQGLSWNKIGGAILVIIGVAVMKLA